LSSTSKEEVLARVRIEESWKAALADQFTASYMRKLREFLIQSLNEGKTIYPPMNQIFAAFNACSLDQVKVVIVGQDPYINEGQAHGLCFSVPPGVQPPPSLENIFKEIQSDLQQSARPGEFNEQMIPPGRGCLLDWAKQGVLLLNSTLTVFASRSASHQGLGWEEFTDRVIEVLNEQRENLVFLLWGNYAKRKGTTIDRSKHLVLDASHPSPMSVLQGFFGCRHFSKTNEYLIAHKKTPIDWLRVF